MTTKTRDVEEDADDACIRKAVKAINAILNDPSYWPEDLIAVEGGLAQFYLVGILHGCVTAAGEALLAAREGVPGMDIEGLRDTLQLIAERTYHRAEVGTIPFDRNPPQQKH